MNYCSFWYPIRYFTVSIEYLDFQIFDVTFSHANGHFMKIQNMLIVRNFLIVNSLTSHFTEKSVSLLQFNDFFILSISNFLEFLKIKIGGFWRPTSQLFCCQTHTFRSNNGCIIFLVSRWLYEDKRIGGGR